MGQGSRVRGASPPFNGAKAGEDDFQVFVCGHRVQLADKEDVLRRSHVSIREVAHLHTHTHTGVGVAGWLQVEAS